MYFKSIFLSIICSAIAFTTVAQVPWLSTIGIKYNDKLVKFLPPSQAWYSKGFNHSVYYCYNSPKKGARRFDSSRDILNSKYANEFLESVSNVPLKAVVDKDPFVVIVSNKDGELTDIPTPVWNVTHNPDERFQDFGIRDFLTSKCEAVAFVETSISFFVRKDQSTVTLFFYKDMNTFVSHNLGKSHALTDLGERELVRWLYYVPVKDITKYVQKVLLDIYNNVDGFYKLNFDSSTFDSYLKDL